MKTQLLNVSPLQTAKVFAALWFVLTLPILLIMAIPMMAMPGPMPGYFSGMMLAMPFLYAAFGFVFTLIGAWVYNLLAARMGGVEFTLVQVPDSLETATGA
jgi:hypothetical protein